MIILQQKFQNAYIWNDCRILKVSLGYHTEQPTTQLKKLDLSIPSQQNIIETLIMLQNGRVNLSISHLFPHLQAMYITHLPLPFHTAKMYKM